MVNDKFIQLHGPFQQGRELVDLIKEKYPDFRAIKKIGIQAPFKHICCINGQNFEIGKTDILEYNEVNITSLYFQQDESITTLIDCILE